MRNTTLLFLLAVARLTQAQPEDLELRFTNPCGMPPNDSVDVTGDGVPDLLIGGYTMGTDDVPSSSGSCTRYVGTLPGTTLLCDLDVNGQRVPKAFAVGDTVPPMDTKVQNDLQIPRLVYNDAAIIALQWGYGHQTGKAVTAAGLEKQVFVFKTIAPHEHRTGTFTLEPLVDLRSVRITVGTLVHADEALIVR